MDLYKQWATVQVLELMNNLGFSDEQVLSAIEEFKKGKEEERK